MISKPILFSGPMVRAILEGRKTQTRRAVKGKALEWLSHFEPGFLAHPENDSLCPHPVGSEMWVRESYFQRGHWEPVSGVKERTRAGRQRWAFVPADDVIVFEAPAEYRKGRHSKDPSTIAWHKRLARFMPRTACRLRLTVTDVRVQRLQDISEEDAKAEGLKCLSKDGGQVWKWGIPDADGEPGNDDHGWHWHEWSTSPAEAYRTLWESINGPGSWDANPWVWAYTFERVS